MRRGAILLAVAAALACSRGSASPAKLDPNTELCGSCRMPVSDRTLASQLAAPGEEPKFFDDLGCLRDFLARGSAPKGTVAFVADHRTGKWIRASAAIYTKATISTPMGSHWIAHADGASRDADPAAKGGSPVERSEIFGSGGPPDG